MVWAEGVWAEGFWADGVWEGMDSGGPGTEMEFYPVLIRRRWRR